ncbi:hypothetical protein HDU85_000288 [Gaertneriomyces sp. JEL0708]|nr:hypothetical protein HDU85_000288 [Gaertneriomyces sp. JEL0708]
MPRPFRIRWIPRVNKPSSTASAIPRFVTVKGSRSLLTLCSACAKRVTFGTSRPNSPHWTITSPITQRQVSTKPVSAETHIKRDVLSEFQHALDDQKFRSARSLAQSNLFGAQLKQAPVRWIEDALKRLAQSPSSSAVHTLRTILFDGLISRLTTSNRTDGIPLSATDRIRYAQELVVDKAIGLYGVTPPARSIHRVVVAQITIGNPDAAQAVLDHAATARIPLFQITFDCLAKERANKFNWEGVRWAWKRAASCTPAENVELIDQKQRIRALAAYVVMHGMDLGPLIFHQLLQNAEISNTEALYDILYNAAPRSDELLSRTRFLQGLLRALVPSFKNVTAGNTPPSQLSRLRVRRISDLIDFMRMRQCVDVADYNLAFAGLLQHGTDEELSKLKQQMDEANILLNVRLSAILAKRSGRTVFMHDAAARAALREKDHTRAVELLHRSIAETRRLSEGVMNGLVKSSFYRNDERLMRLCWMQMTQWQQQPSLWSYAYRISLALLEYKPSETLRLVDQMLLASRDSGVSITERMCITILRQAADHVIKRPNSHFVLKVFDTLMQEGDISLSPRLCELGFTLLGRFQEVKGIEELIERADTFAGSLDAEELHNIIRPLVRCGFRDQAALLIDRMGDAGVLPNQKTTELLLGATGFDERRISEAQTDVRAKADISRLLRISDGEEFRSALGITDIPTNVRSYTSLITSRLKAHDPVAAEHLYQSLKKAGVVPNEVTFLQLINYFAQTQNASKVRAYLDEMEACNVRPTPQILASLITGLSKIDSLALASSESLVFDMMTKFCIEPDTVLMNSLMAARVRHSDVIGAHSLLTRFAGRCSPNRVTFHILIHGYCESRTVQQMLVAEGLLKHIEQSSDPLIRVQSEHPYTDFIMNFAHLGDMRAAIGVLQRMQEHNVPATTTTHAAIINGYCINGDLRNAWKHFNAIFLQTSADVFPLPLRHDVVVPLLKAYAASENSDDLFAFLRTLTAAGLSITSHMHNIVLSHLAQYRPGELDSYYQQHIGAASGVSEFTLLSILAGFKNSGASEQALRWFTKLTGILLEDDTRIQLTKQKPAVVPGIKSYTALLGIAPDAAVLSLYSFMMAQGVRPTAATICSIIDRYAKAGKEADVFDWLIRWEEVKACEGKRSSMAIEHLACLLEARGRAQNLAGVEEVWRWATHGCEPFNAGTVSMCCEPVLAKASTSVEPLVCLYLDNISRLAPFEQLENAWTQVSGLPVFPTSNIYTSYIEGLVRHGKYTEAVEFLTDAKRKHKPGMPVADSRKTLHNLLKGIRARDPSEAMRVLKLLKMHNLGRDLPLDALMA